MRPARAIKLGRFPLPPVLLKPCRGDHNKSGQPIFRLFCLPFRALPGEGVSYNHSGVIATLLPELEQLCDEEPLPLINKACLSTHAAGCANGAPVVVIYVILFLSYCILCY